MWRATSRRIFDRFLLHVLAMSLFSSSFWRRCKCNDWDACAIAFLGLTVV